MDTNRLGNLKRFFDIGDDDRVFDAVSSDGAEISKAAGVKYDYIFWNERKFRPEQEIGTSLKAMFSHLSEKGKLVVYFNNPCSIHNLSQGALDFEKMAEFSYPRFRRQIQEFCREENIFARWYYPYPNVDFPFMFFSDERLPVSGECDDNFYHFGEARAEVFDEREAVDALVDSEMYPYLAHAYMVVLSRGKMWDMPRYTRFSNERRADRQIRTDLLSEVVKKTAVCREAAEHIKQMTCLEGQLQDVFGNLSILGRPCEINRLIETEEAKMSASFAYAEGESLESVLDAMLAGGKEKEVADILLDIVGQLQNLEGQKSFTETEEFEEIFGKLPSGDKEEDEAFIADGWMTLPVTDIDMVSQNIILSAEKAVIIDYEWTFSFPIPLKYLIFRFLYFYLEAKMRDGIQRESFADLYEKAGISSKEEKCFLAMETHFQRYVQQGAAVLRNEYDLRGGALMTKEELGCLLKEKESSSADVYYEDGTKADIRGKTGKDGIETFLVLVKDSKSLEFRYSSGNRIFRIGAMTERDGKMKGISFSTDAMSLGGLLYLFEDGEIKITFKNLSRADYQILISLEEIKMSASAVEELARNITDLRFVIDNREKQLSDVKNSASWKLTRPLRMLKGNKEE